MIFRLLTSDAGMGAEEVILAVTHIFYIGHLQWRLDGRKYCCSQDKKEAIEGYQ